MHRISGFVHQDDLFMGHLTVLEHLTFMVGIKIIVLTKIRVYSVNSFENAGKSLQSLALNLLAKVFSELKKYLIPCTFALI